MKTPDGKDTNVLSKTPEEIKKGLECHSKNLCARNVCPYFDTDGCGEAVSSDVKKYIEQLEERNNRLEYTLMGVMHSVDKWLRVEPYDFDKDDGTEAATRAANAREIALKAIEQLERERDAAVEILRSMHCDTCIYDEHYPIPNVCFDCIEYCNWEWRGVKEEKNNG